MPPTRGWIISGMPDFTNSSGALLHHGSELDQVKQSLLMLLSIRKSELLCAPDFGHALQQFAFMPNLNLVRNQIAQHISQIISQCEPRAKHVDIRVECHPEKMTHVQLEIAFQLGSEHSRTQLTLSYHMQGGLHATVD